MKIYGFSFKREAIWMMVFNFVLLAIGLLFLLVLWLLH
jgi:hypothetical protein